MDMKKATELLQVLLTRTADCQCGNFDISREEAKAIEFFVKHATHGTNYDNAKTDIVIKTGD